VQAVKMAASKIKFNKFLSITPDTLVKCFDPIYISGDPNEVMLSILFFDNYIKYNFQRFLSENQESISNEAEKKEIKHILTGIKNAKRAWFSLHFVNRQKQRPRDDLRARFAKLLSKLPEPEKNIFRRYISETDKNEEQVVQAIESEKRKAYATIIEMTK